MNRAETAPNKPEAGGQEQPWWRVGMVWVVLGGPLTVVIASVVTAVIAWKHIDPVITPARPGVAETRAGDEVASPGDVKSPLAPALKARNHAATPAQ